MLYAAAVVVAFTYFRAAIFVPGLGGLCTRTDARALSRGGDLLPARLLQSHLIGKYCFLLLQCYMAYIDYTFPLAPFWSLGNG